MTKKLSIPGIPPHADLGISNFMNSSVNLYKQVDIQLSDVTVLIRNTNTAFTAIKELVSKNINNIDDITIAINTLKLEYEKNKLEVEEKLKVVDARLLALESIAHPPGD